MGDNTVDSKEKNIDEMTLEEAFAGLDEIMEKLSDNDISLEQSVNLYKDGMELLGHCKKVVDEAEGKLVTLSGEAAE